MTLEATARCGAHPLESASQVCVRCGVFLCAGCVREEQGQPHCASCVERLKRADAPSEARQALLLSVIGLGVWPIAAVALVLGLRALRRAEAGQARPEDGRLALTAVRVAAVGLVWPVFAIGLYFFRA